MNKQKAKVLLDQYLQGKATKEQEALVQYWLLREAGKNKQEMDEQAYQQKHIEMWDVVAKAVGASEEVIGVKRLKLWPRVTVAIAAAVAVIVFGIWFYTFRDEYSPRPELVSITRDIKPGRNTATLTLANGKTIVLSDAKSGVVIGTDLKYNDSSMVDGQPVSNSLQESSVIETLTATTPRGGTYQIILPDGSRIWMNADSKISFPSRFTGKERKIFLSGEAYLEVAKDKTHPFIVKTDKQEVKVLGTHFNINCYDDEASTKTTLLEGAVQVSLPEGKSVLLKPNEQAVLTSSNLKVSEVEVEEMIAWKKGDFIFNGETLESILRKVSRWYDVDVVYAENAPKNFTLGGFVSRSKPISAVLELIEKTGKVKFQVTGRKINVLP